MSLSIRDTLALSFVSYVLWRIFRPYIVKTPLSNIPGPSSTSWLLGNFEQIISISPRAWGFHDLLAKKYGAVAKTYGIWGREELFVHDPLALHHIVLKDQTSFEKPRSTIEQVNMMFGECLLSVHGSVHRRQRKMLTPVFSLKHMRGLAPIFYPIAHELRDVLIKEVNANRGGTTTKSTEPVELNIMRFLSRAALEYIGRGGLGHSFGSIDGSKSSSYLDTTRLLGPTGAHLAKFFLFLPYLVKIGSPSFRRKVVQWMPWKLVRDMQKNVDAIDGQARNVYNLKKEALLKGDDAVVQQVGSGKDIMSILLKANLLADEGDQLPEEELISQMNLLIFAGHETTTVAICLALLKLSKDPARQTRLREEVSRARSKDGDLDYDVLMALPFLDAVCRETLRTEPPVAVLTRVAVQDVAIPLFWPITSTEGETINELHIPRGTKVMLSVQNSNRSKAIWGPDAETWRPERWLEPQPESVIKAHLPGVYSSMMTFNGGVRSCIGFKFAELEMKLVLSILLETFTFFPSEKEVTWTVGGLRRPVLDGELKSTLPLKVGLVNDMPTSMPVPVSA